MAENNQTFLMIWHVYSPGESVEEGLVKIGSEMLWIDQKDLENPQEYRKLLDRIRRKMRGQEPESVTNIVRENYFYGNEQCIDEKRSLFTRVRDYVTKNYTLKDIGKRAAREYGLTERAICDLFKREMHMTFRDFLRTMRVMRAQNMIVEERLPLGTIYERVGYKSYSGFQDAYKIVCGHTPSEDIPRN